MKNEQKKVSVADLAKALKVKSDVRAGIYKPPTSDGCPTCGIAGGHGGVPGIEG
jgi:hypothetical protein